MKAKTIFLTSLTGALLLVAQISKPPKPSHEPLPANPGIPEITECVISDFISREIEKTSDEIPCKAVTPPQEIEIPKTDTIPHEIQKTGTQAEAFLEPPAEEVASSQSSQSTIPKMGDTRVVDGQKQCYFLGFGWIDDNDQPNECIYAEDMYENGNKVGTMG